MKRRLAVLVVGASLAVFVSCTPSEEKTTTTSSPAASAGTASESPESVIKKLEHDWVHAIVAKDADTINRILADDFIGTTNDQTYSKADAIEDVKSGIHESLDMSDINVRVFDNAAVVTLTQNEKSRHDKEDFSGRYLFTNVWVKRNGEWRAVASHGSRVR
jgi:ketosteroid isomerase-like protein